MSAKEPDAEHGGADDDPRFPDPSPLSVIIRAGRFATTLDILMSAADEAILRFGRDGIDVSLVDPANVYMVRQSVAPSAFEHVGDGQFPAGVNLDAWADYIDKADADEPIKLDFDAETRRVSVEYGPFDRSFALIDPDSIRREPDTADLDLPNRMQLEGRLLSDVVDVSAMVSDHIEIEGDPDDECVRVIADGDRDTNTATLTDELQTADVTEQASTILSVDYLESIVDVMPSDAVVAVSSGEQFPVMFEWEYIDGDASVTQTLAPRIQSR
jgi:proliferating cell nuclear antigen